MVMDSWGGEDSGALMAQQEEEARLERERLAAYQAGPLPPPPPTTGQVAGGFFGQQFNVPPPPVGDLMAPLMPPPPPPDLGGPPMILGVPQGGPQEFGQSVPFDPALVANLTTQQGAPVTYGPRDLMGEVQQALHNTPFLPPSVFNAVGSALDTPALNFVPGGTALNAGLNAAGVNSPSISEAYMQDIPIISPFMRDTVQPFAGDVGSVLGTSVNQLGVGVPNLLLDQLGTSTQDVGRFLGEGATPVSLGDFAVNAALAGGPVEALTGLPIDDLARAARSGIGNYATDFLNPGMFSPEALGGREAAGIQLRGGLPIGAAPPAPYPSMPEGTMGQQFPDVVAASGGRIDPESPAARMGAPLAYDPQFMTPPPADAAMRDLGLSPQQRLNDLTGTSGQLPGGERFVPSSGPPLPEPPDLVPNYAPPDIYGRTFYDQPEVGPARVGLPTDPFARPDVAGSLEQRMAGGGTPLREVTPPQGFAPGTTPQQQAYGRAAMEDAAAQNRQPLALEQEYKALSQRVQAAEKTPDRLMSPEETAMMDRDWQEYSRVRGYTEAEIADMQRLNDLHDQAVRSGIPSDEVFAWDREVQQGLVGGGTPPAPTAPTGGVYEQQMAVGDRVQYGDPWSVGATAPRQLTGTIDHFAKDPITGEMVPWVMRENGRMDPVPGIFDKNDFQNLSRQTGGGTPPAPTAAEAGLAPPASPPPASLTPSEGQVVRIAVQPDAVKPLEDFIAPGKGFELTDPSKARILGEGETVEPGEILMLHGTGNAGIQGDLRVGTNLTTDATIANRSAISEARLEGTPGAAGGVAPSAGPSVTVGGPATTNAVTPPEINALPLPQQQAVVQQVSDEVRAVVNNMPSVNTLAPADRASLEGALQGLFDSAKAQAGGAPPGGAPPAPPSRSGPGRGAGPRADRNNPLGSAWNALMELGYFKFGGDLSNILRQLDVRTLSPFTIGETVGKIKAMGDMVNPVTAAAKGQEWVDRIKAIAPDLKTNFANSKGEWIDREMFSSTLAGHIPKVGPAYDATQRMFTGGINENRVLGLEAFVRHNPNATARQLQTEWNYLERVTGRGTFGFLDPVLSKTAGLFTALRFAASWPQRVGTLIPVNVMDGLKHGEWDLFGPTWREAARDHAGFLMTGTAAMIAAQQAGLETGLDPKKSVEENIRALAKGDIVNGRQHINIFGGGSKYAELILNMIDGQKNGKDLGRGDIALQFIRNLSGPLVGEVSALLRETNADKLLGIEKQIQFLYPDYWDRGVTGKNLGIADRFAQHFTFLWVQSVIKNVMAESGPDNKITAEGIKQGAIAAPIEILGGNAQAFVPNKLEETRTEVKNDPSLPEAIRGVEYKDLGPDGKKAQDALAQEKYPDQFKQGEADRNKNSDPAFTKNKEVNDQINKEESDRKTSLYNAMREGKLSGSDVRTAREAIQSAANARRDEARNNPAFKDAVSKLEQNDVNKALAVFYAIQDQTKGPDGKTDFAAARQKQFEMMQVLDPKTQSLLLFEINTKKAADNPLDQLYQMAQPVLQHYFGDVKDVGQRTNERRGNPKDDALLNLLGYEQRTLTTQAAQMLQQMRSSLPAQNAPVPVGAAAPVQRSSQPAPPAPPPPQAPAAAITGARLPPVVANDSQQRTNFVQAMAGPANQYAATTKIPPAVWAAMGASESNWGRAPSVFGIKGTGSAGGADLATHEIINGQRVNMNDQFAAYNNLDDAFRHFTDLTSQGRYAPAWQNLQQTGDWDRFLHDINKAGYATAPNWADSIVSLSKHIEQNYGLRR